MKDERFNLNIMTIVLKAVVSYDVLGLEESYQGTCLGMHFLKIVNMLQQMKKFVKTLTYVFIKITQKDL